MRFKTVRYACIVLAILSVSNISHAQYSRLTVNPEDARRMGMEIMWRTQLTTGRYSQLQGMVQVFGKSKKLVKYVVSFQDVVEEFFEDDVDRFGRKIGVNGAKAKAESRLKRYQSIGFDTAKMEKVVEDPDVLQKLLADLNEKLKTAQGIEKGNLENQILQAEARRRRLLPEITFLMQSTTSAIQSVDGRTGKTNWVQQIGRRDLPSMPVMARDDYFAVVNGTTCYCGLLENGRVVWSRECRGAPGTQAAMTRNSIFVPMVNGIVEQFFIRNGNAPSGDISSIGQILLGATSSNSVVAWPSDRGELNVAYDTLDLKSVSYRLVPKKQIVSTACFLEPYIFATSTDGSLYCLKESSGQLAWEVPTGIPISRSPFAVNKHVYFVNDSNELTQVEIQSGIPTWSAEGINQVVAESSKRVYCLNRLNRLIVLDIKTGRYIGALTHTPVDFVYQNQMTDRLIVGNSHGLVQCLREIEQVEPIFYQKPKVAQESKATDKTTPAAQQNDGQKKNDTNPFGGGKKSDDPFGNPFGAGGGDKKSDDPFGGAGAGGGKKNDDPFGDPFGGGGDGAKKNDDPFGN